VCGQRNPGEELASFLEKSSTYTKSCPLSGSGWTASPVDRAVLGVSHRGQKNIKTEIMLGDCWIERRGKEVRAWRWLLACHWTQSVCWWESYSSLVLQLDCIKVCRPNTSGSLRGDLREPEAEKWQEQRNLFGGREDGAKIVFPILQVCECWPPSGQP